jgi:hypothetical protein
MCATEDNRLITQMLAHKTQKPCCKLPLLNRFLFIYLFQFWDIHEKERNSPKQKFLSLSCGFFFAKTAHKPNLHSWHKGKPLIVQDVNEHNNVRICLVQVFWNNNKKTYRKDIDFTFQQLTKDSTIVVNVCNIIC